MLKEATTDERTSLLHQTNTSDDDDVSDDVTTVSSSCCGRFKDPASVGQRLLVLLLMCFLSFGSYFCMDNPTALHLQFNRDLNMTDTNYMGLYSWYSWPNVVFCFLGGILIDQKLGVRNGSILFCGFLLVGQCVFATGAYINNLALMFTGRFIFGIGGESLMVAQNCYTVKWFGENERNFVFGLQISMSRIGSTITMNVMQPVYNLVRDNLDADHPLAISLYLAASTCIFSLICCLVLGYLDKRRDNIVARRKQQQQQRYTSDDEAATTTGGADEAATELGSVREFLTDMKQLKHLQLWLVFIICVAYYVCVFTFIGMATTLFTKKFEFTPEQASRLNSIVYLLSAILSPVCGFIVDKLGRHVMFVCIAVAMGLTSHVLMTLTMLNPYVAMVLLGISLSFMACALWPLVPLIVPVRLQATAYGLMQAIQNFGMATMALLTGYLMDNYGFLTVGLFYMGCLSIALLSTIALYFLDLKRESNLNISAKRRNLLNSVAAAVKYEEI